MFMANGQLDYRQEETEMIQENTEEEDSQKGDTREVFLSNNSSNERERSNTFPFNGTISPRSVNGRQYTQMNSTMKSMKYSPRLEDTIDESQEEESPQNRKEAKS